MKKNANRRRSRGAMATFDGFPSSDHIEEFMKRHNIGRGVKLPKPGLLVATGPAKHIRQAVQDIHLPDGVVVTTSKVKAAAHHQIQRRTRRPYGKAIRRAHLSDPDRPILANDEEGTSLRRARSIENHLVDQMTEMADWEAVIEAVGDLMISGVPVREVVEFGPDTRYGLSGQIVRGAKDREVGPIRAIRFVPKNYKFED